MYNNEKYVLSVNVYGNVRGVPNGWHETDLTVTQLKKLEIPTYKSCIGFSGKYYKPIIVNIIHDDFSELEESYIDELEKKNEEKNNKINQLKLTEKVVAKALYSINKEAKRQRDLQEKIAFKIYDDECPCYMVAPHTKLHAAKNRKEELYLLKEQVLQKVIQELALSPEGYHEFSDRDRDLYLWCGFSFHINEKKSEKCLGDIDEYIPAKRERSTPPNKAEQLLFVLGHT